MVIKGFSTNEYGVVMLLIFSAYAVGAILISYMAKFVDSYATLCVLLPAYFIACIIMSVSESLNIKLGLISLLMFLSPMITNRMSRYIVLFRPYHLDAALGIFSFFYSVAAIFASAITTWIGIHSINHLGSIILLNITLAYATFLSLGFISDYKTRLKKVK